MSAPATSPARHGVIGPVLFGGHRPRPSELPAYASFFGFVAAPFDLTLDPRFVYLGASHTRARAEILDGLQRREGLIVLTGASGTGKTTLCRWTLQSVPAPTFASIVVDPLVTPHELLVQVLMDFGVISAEFAGGDSVSHIGCHELTLVLRRFLDSLVPSGARALIVIDDAHQVSTAVLAQLRALSNLETTTAKQLQIMLIGQPGLESTLATAELDSLRQRVSRQCRLEPLTAAEMAGFVDHRIAVACGGAAGPHEIETESDAIPAVCVKNESGEAVLSFSPASLTVLAQLSAGVPRTLTQLCDRALDVAASRHARRITPDHVFQAAQRLNLPVRLADRIRIGRSVVMLASALCVAALFWGLWWLRHDAVEPSRTLERAVASRPATPPASIPAVVPGDVKPQAADASVPVSAAPSTGLAGAPLADAESFLVVVASFKNADAAQGVREQLVDQMHPAFVRDDGPWHVVLIGPFGTRVEADATLDQLDRARFVDARVTQSN